MGAILADGLELIALPVGAYVLGWLLTLPGLVIGKHLETPGVPKWHGHVAVLVVGLMGWGILTATRFG